MEGICLISLLFSDKKHLGCRILSVYWYNEWIFLNADFSHLDQVEQEN